MIHFLRELDKDLDEMTDKLIHGEVNLDEKKTEEAVSMMLFYAHVINNPESYMDYQTFKNQLGSTQVTNL